MLEAHPESRQGVARRRNPMGARAHARAEGMVRLSRMKRSTKLEAERLGASAPSDSRRGGGEHGQPGDIGDGGDERHLDADLGDAEEASDAREERLALLRLVVGDHAGDAANVEQRCAFHRRAARDRVVASAVGGGGLASALRDIERDGYGCALELIADLAFTAGKLPDEVQGKGEEIDRAPVGIKVS